MAPHVVSHHSVGELYKYHFAAGAMGLSLSYSAMHPLDTLKTRIQAAAARGQNWHTVFTRETARSLGKGFFVSALGAAGQGGARFSTYEFCKSQLLPTTSWTIPMTALSAVLGDLASSVIKVPREVITAKLQTDHYGGRATAATVVRQTLIEEGPVGMFRGFWAIAARDSPFMVILLVSYENFKKFHRQSVFRERQHTLPAVVANASFEDIEIPTFKSMAYGGVSGFLAGYLTTPMDVLRTRMITSQKHSNGVSLSAWQTARYLARASGSVAMTYKTFFSGSLSRSVWWFGICSIFFPTYETLKAIMID